MKVSFRLISACLMCLAVGLAPVQALAQQNPVNTSANSVAEPEAATGFTAQSATLFINRFLQQQQMHQAAGGTLEQSLRRLLDQAAEPFDSVRLRLERIPVSPALVKPMAVAYQDTLPLRWLDPRHFIIDTVRLDREPVVIYKTILMRALDPVALSVLEPSPLLKNQVEALLKASDTITNVRIDYTYLSKKNIQVFELRGGQVYPSVVGDKSAATAIILDDSANLVISGFRTVFSDTEGKRFGSVYDLQASDSLQRAVHTLISYVQQRDSILIQLRNHDGHVTGFWLSGIRDDLFRYWVKNSSDDSVSIWLGNPRKQDLTLVLEDNVRIERMRKWRSDEALITFPKPSRMLQPMKPVTETPAYWDVGYNSSFSFNQNYLSNWARGGESSFSGMLDAGSRAVYTNKENKTQWTNTLRLRYGAIWTKARGIRTSNDILELNSKYNKVIKGKLDFSTVMFMKTQVAKGYKLPADTRPVSKFMSPGSIIVGMGLEYKPWEKTMINFSMLSYKNTFVLDTASIDQRTFGIDRFKKSKQEMGGQLVMKNTMTVLDGTNLSNSVRLFSNYLSNPQNVDVEWEMSVEKQINWFLGVRFSFHLIYDDDSRFPVLDEAGKPILLPDGSKKLQPRTQLNQFMGLTFSIKL